jgi:hypothetical protein
MGSTSPVMQLEQDPAARNTKAPKSNVGDAKLQDAAELEKAAQMRSPGMIVRG